MYLLCSYALSKLLQKFPFDPRLDDKFLRWVLSEKQGHKQSHSIVLPMQDWDRLRDLNSQLHHEQPDQRKRRQLLMHLPVAIDLDDPAIEIY